jgi:hypothetical protein
MIASKEYVKRQADTSYTYFHHCLGFTTNAKCKYLYIVICAGTYEFLGDNRLIILNFMVITKKVLQIKRDIYVDFWH